MINTTMPRIKSLRIILALLILPLVATSQFYDGFESGTYIPTWTDEAGTYTRTVTTTAPAVGTYSFSLDGGASTFFDGISTSFSPIQATEVSWRLKADGTGSHGYFNIGDSTTVGLNSGMARVRMIDGAELRFYNGTTSFNHPVTANTWILIELKNINWVAKTFDIYVDSLSISTDFPFLTNTITNLSEIHLYNFNSGIAYFDEINVLAPCIIDTSVDISASPTLTSNQTADSPSYQWLYCDSNYAVIPSATSILYTATASGNYAVEITVGSCIDTSACQNVIISDANELSVNKVSIYPNPTNGIVNLNFDNISSEINYTITAINGQEIETGKTLENNFSIDLSTQPKGIYIIKATTNKGVAVEKIVLK